MIDSPNKSSNIRNKNKYTNLRLFFSNTNSGNIDTKTINKDCIINFITDYEKDFFSDNTYINMKYNEIDLFKDNSIYDKYIKNEFENFKKSRNLENPRFEKILKYGKYKKEINLNLNSVEISFKNLAIIPDLEEKKLTIDL